MTNVEALKALYAALGGDPADVADATTIVGVLNVIAAKYEGADDATANAEAIANIAAVAENIGGGGNAEFSAIPAEFAAIKNLISVDIPEGVTETDGSAFVNFTGLQKVTFPSTLNRISNYTFQGCTSLKSIEIPQHVATIGSGTFTACTALETITINKPEGSITGAPWGAPETTQIIWNG